MAGGQKKPGRHSRGADQDGGKFQGENRHSKYPEKKGSEDREDERAARVIIRPVIIEGHDQAADQIAGHCAAVKFFLRKDKEMKGMSEKEKNDPCADAEKN